MFLNYMEQINTLVNTITQIVKIKLNQNEQPIMIKHKEKIHFEKKPAAYKSINSSSLNVFL